MADDLLWGRLEARQAHRAAAAAANRLDQRNQTRKNKEEAPAVPQSRSKSSSRTTRLRKLSKNKKTHSSSSASSDEGDDTPSQRSKQSPPPAPPQRSTARRSSRSRGGGVSKFIPLYGSYNRDGAADDAEDLSDFIVSDDVVEEEEEEEEKEEDDDPQLESDSRSSHKNKKRKRLRPGTVIQSDDSNESKGTDGGEQSSAEDRAADDAEKEPESQKIRKAEEEKEEVLRLSQRFRERGYGTELQLETENDPEDAEEEDLAFLVNDDNRSSTNNQEQPIGETVRCICDAKKYTKKNPYDGMWVQCSNEDCGVWLHGNCVGIKSEKDIPEVYLCPQCTEGQEEQEAAENKSKSSKPVRRRLRKKVELEVYRVDEKIDAVKSQTESTITTTSNPSSQSASKDENEEKATPVVKRKKSKQQLVVSDDSEHDRNPERNATDRVVKTKHSVVIEDNELEDELELTPDAIDWAALEPAEFNRMFLNYAMTGKEDFAVEAARFLGKNRWLQCEDTRGRNAWHLAAIHSQAATLAALTRLAGSENALIKQDKLEKMSAEYAAENGLLEVMQLIAEKVVLYGKSINRVDELLLRVLMAAVNGDQEATLRALIRFVGKDLNLNQLDYEGVTLLHSAAKGKHKCLVALLEAGARVDTRDRDQWTPLLWAIDGGHIECAESLIAFGADVCYQDTEGRCAMHLAAGKGRTECIRLLGKSEPRCVFMRDHVGWPPLLYADFHDVTSLSLSPPVLDIEFKKAVQCQHDATIELIKIDPNQISLLGDLLYEQKSRNRVVSILKSFASAPMYYGLVNDFLRPRIHLLDSKFSFMWKKKEMLDYDNRRRYFYSKLNVGEDVYITCRDSIKPLVLDRENVIDSAIWQLLPEYTDTELHRLDARDRKPLSDLQMRYPTVKNECAAGPGVRRECFQLLSRAVVDTNRKAFVQREDLSYDPGRGEPRTRELCGVLFAWVIVTREKLDVRLSKALLKSIIEKPIEQDDVEAVEPDFFRNLRKISDKEAMQASQCSVEDLGLTFCVESADERTGATQTYDLKTRGSELDVTESNKAEYIRLMTDWKVANYRNRIGVNSVPFLRGLYRYISAKQLAVFNEGELELLVCGMDRIDVADWKANTVYQGYTCASDQIVWFWKVVEEKLKDEERSLLLKFATASSRVPAGGFAELRSSKFTIVRLYETDRLPSAATCFNMLKLPAYRSFDELHRQILLAIRFGSEGFSFA